eukprot:gnl/Spiro4/22038_TR10835_c3_g1_i1.p1 gnl/Spiro4/22038_TR10835_c3_g1~~gnl/Spiro4/22038_TR10835_c3_g1_i1.p1  ORF type:complete len:157 (-),score=23.62 gnl/Spiro4/22038_TR10835_c3_g1_i1:219-659(-)
MDAPINILRVSARLEACDISKKPGARETISNYLKQDLPCLHFSSSSGIVEDRRTYQHHQSRDRDVLFIDTRTLARVAGSTDSTIGQNLTVDGCVVGDWCVGDLLRVGESALVRISGPRKPCPKNDTVHGGGTLRKMMQNALVCVRR